MKNNHFKCEVCDTLTKTGFVSRKVVRKGKQFVLEIEAEVCPNCKEEYYDGGKLLEFEQSVKKQLAIV